VRDGSTLSSSLLKFAWLGDALIGGTIITATRFFLPAQPELGVTLATALGASLIDHGIANQVARDLSKHRLELDFETSRTARDLEPSSSRPERSEGPMRRVQAKLEKVEHGYWRRRVGPFLRGDRSAVATQVRLVGPGGEVFAASDGKSKEAPLGTTGTLPPAIPPILSCKVSFQDSSGDNALDAEEAGTIRLRVENTGKGPAIGLVGRVTGQARGLNFPSEINLGDVAPGGQSQVDIPVTGHRQLDSGQASLTISLMDRNGFDAPLVRQHFETRAFVRPQFDVKLGVEDGNGNGLVERGEELTLKVLVKNEGGFARGVRLALQGPDEIRWLDTRDTIFLGDIPAGEWRQSAFSCVIRNQYAGPETISLKAVISEKRPDIGETVPVSLTLNQVGPTIIEQAARARTEGQTNQAVPELSDPVDTAPKRQQRQPNSRAIIIGIERYANALVPTVSFARRDATILREYMIDTLGVPPENIRLLINHEASLASLKTAISRQIANEVEGLGARVYVYFAGHGVPNLKTKDPYLVPFDGNPAYPETSCYALSDIYRDLGNLNVPVAVLLDACFTGTPGRGDASQSLIADARPALVEAKAISTPPNVSVLAAADGDQVSSGYSSKRHGLFTYFLLRGLSGEADDDRDSRLTLHEMHRYLVPRVQRQARKLEREQTPTLQGAGDVVLY
jgi:hypothetical protein